MKRPRSRDLCSRRRVVSVLLLPDQHPAPPPALGALFRSSLFAGRLNLPPPTPPHLLLSWKLQPREKSPLPSSSRGSQPRPLASPAPPLPPRAQETASLSALWPCTGGKTSCLIPVTAGNPLRKAPRGRESGFLSEPAARLCGFPTEGLGGKPPPVSGSRSHAVR